MNPSELLRDSGDDSEEESEILEESPCGRYLKRREEVDQKDVPGVDGTFLAMDTEEGVEVVWNEVCFQERKNFKVQEKKIQDMFENLTQLSHPNVMKFHRYWTDTHDDKPRVIFITEYMSSGSLKQFLKRTKNNMKRLPLASWRRWCTQILSALHYLHSCRPPIIHGYLTCDTIFIQHNGLVKIGSVAPDTIRNPVKSCGDKMQNIHFIAPEYDEKNVTKEMDIYSFGMCALEMAALDIYANGESGGPVNEQQTAKTIATLENALQRDFIHKCVQVKGTRRPSARELMFHPLLFEVPSLKLLAAYSVIHCAASNISETITEHTQKLCTPPTKPLAVLHFTEADKTDIEFKFSDASIHEKLEKFVEDVKNGIYPLSAFKQREPPTFIPRSLSPDLTDSTKSTSPEPLDVEERKVGNMMCNIKPKDDGIDLVMTVLFRMEDKINRQLSCVVTHKDSPQSLATELVYYGFINEADKSKVAALIEETMRGEVTGENGCTVTKMEEGQPAVFPPLAPLLTLR